MAVLGDTNNIDIKIKASADTSGIKDTEKALHGMGTQSESSGMSFGKMAGAVAAGQAVFAVASRAVSEVTGFVKESVKAYSESQNAVTQLNSVLLSTKGVAGVTSQAAIELSKALQRTTAYSDEQVLSVENMGLTFTAIHKDIFPAATKAAMDMAVALNHGLTPSGDEATQRMVMLGKALQDPDAGLGALHRVGVNVDQLKKQFVGVSDVATKQKLILKELQTEFGGSSVAAGHTFAGSMQKLKNTINDVQESIGKTIVDGITPFIGAAAKLAASIDWEKVIAKTKGAIKDFVKEMDTWWWAVDKVYQAVERYLAPKLKDLLKSVENLYGPVKKFVEEYIWPLIEVLGPAVGKGLVWVLGLTIDWFKEVLKIAAPVFQFLDDHKGVVIVLAATFGTLAAAMALGAAFDAITVGFATMQLVQIPALMAQLAFLRGAFIAAVPYLAIGVAIGAIILSFHDMKNAIEDTRKALDSFDKSQDNAIKSIQQSVKDKKISQSKGAAMIAALGADNNKGNGNAPGGNFLSKVFGGFASGGYTGKGNSDEIAGVVHRGEYVVPSNQVDQRRGEPKPISNGSGMTINQTNNIYNQVDMAMANRELGWRLANA